MVWVRPTGTPPQQRRAKRIQRAKQLLLEHAIAGSKADNHQCDSPQRTRLSANVKHAMQMAISSGAAAGESADEVRGACAVGRSGVCMVPV